MANSHGNPDDLAKVARQLRSTKGEIRSLGQSLKQTMASADWDDKVKQRIDADIKSALGGLNKFADKLDEHANVVDKKARELRQYLGQ